MRQEATQPAVAPVTLSLKYTRGDKGENAAVTLANAVDADQPLCDGFNRLALIHVSLLDSRLVAMAIGQNLDRVCCLDDPSWRRGRVRFTQLERH